ncbi:hypothetical protein [Pantoea sp. Mhis]|uniref:hypothetical protein n=1 Tax=Pantoea sp. Mhis TaxID=2576759 RepID=UPI0013594E85|nr:hypothetical protein [Pantoea sp. Mhis]
MQAIVNEPYLAKLLSGFTESHKAIEKISAMICMIAGLTPIIFTICNTINTV